MPMRKAPKDGELASFTFDEQVERGVQREGSKLYMGPMHGACVKKKKTHAVELRRRPELQNTAILQSSPLATMFFKFRHLKEGPCCRCIFLTVYLQRPVNDASTSITPRHDQDFIEAVYQSFLEAALRGGPFWVDIPQNLQQE